MTLHRIYFGNRTAAAASQPQRLEFWKPVALVALGFFAADEPRAAPPDNRIFYGKSQSAAAAATQPFWIGRRAALPAPEDEPYRRIDQLALHRYRFNFQTVGQPWLTWPRATRALEIEGFESRRPVDLMPFRSSAGAAVVGQPWYFWHVARGDQSIEPDAVRVSYTATFFNRSEAVIVPPVIGFEWIIRARRRKGR